jgi:hypothetical protein
VARPEMLINYQMGSRIIKILLTMGLAAGSNISFANCDFKLIDSSKDYLNVPGPITFDHTSYVLKWSSHLADNYFKQEYGIPGESVDSFSNMIFIDAVVGSKKLSEIVSGKILELEARKLKDVVVNYKLIQSPDSTEYILDFVISQGGERLDFVEWSIYRYKTFSDKSGRRGILIFGNSIRSYGNRIEAFFSKLPNIRKRLIKIFIDYKIPEVTILVP